MKIYFKADPRAEFKEMEVQKGITCEDVYKQVKNELKYIPTMAKVNNRVRRLTFELTEEGQQVELCDIRTQAANIIYQNSVAFIFFKAMKDLYGKQDIDIENSIAGGLYVKITDVEITDEMLKAAEARMREIVDADYPIEYERIEIDDAIEIAKELSMTEDIKLLSQKPDNRTVRIYSMDGYRDFFSYDYMVPSSGYVQYFELRKYKEGLLLRFPQPANPNKIPEFRDEFVLYDTFEEQAKWGELMEVDYASDINEIIEQGKFQDLVLLSEALHEQKICKLAEDIKALNRRIILIAGPSSSGKTTFAKRLCIQLRVNGLKPIYMGTDDYFVERDETPLDEYGEKNYEDLDAVDVKLFNQNMNDLLAGKEVDLPTFNFMTGQKEFGKRITKMVPGQVLVIEGIHALNEKMTSEISKDDKYKIYISPLTSLKIDSHNRVVTTDHRMLRRMARDYKYRGHSAQDTINSWPKVRAGEDKNIFPYANEADAMFNSVHLYEIPILRHDVEPLLMAIKEDEPEYGDANRMLNFLRFFKPFEDESIVPTDSILREFIGGSVFTD